MFNHAFIDKYITFEHLQLLMGYFASHSMRERPSDMLHSIERQGNEYILHVTDAASGYSHRFRIENQQVIDLGIDRLWMS